MLPRLALADMGILENTYEKRATGKTATWHVTLIVYH